MLWEYKGRSVYFSLCVYGGRGYMVLVMLLEFGFEGLVGGFLGRENKEGILGGRSRLCEGRSRKEYGEWRSFELISMILLGEW